MSRYVFFNSANVDAKGLAAAKRTAKAMGVTVVRSVAGSMLVEAAPTQLQKVANALPGWKFSVERKTARIPEQRPLERAKVMASKA